MNIKIFSFLVLSLIGVSPIEAGVRCTLGGDTGCSAGCALLGQTSGICDDEGNFGLLQGVPTSLGHTQKCLRAKRATFTKKKLYSAPNKPETSSQA